MSEYSELVKRLNDAKGTVCPFDKGQPDPGLETTDPCPVCGDLGTFEPFDGEDNKPSMCIHGDARKAAQAIERLGGEKEELERRATFIEHEHPQNLELHFTAAMSLLTERKAFSKSEVAQLIAEQMECANDAGKRCSRVLMANEQLRARAQEAEQQLTDARAEIERKDRALETIVHAPAVGFAGPTGGAFAAEVARKALAAPAPGKDSEGKE